MIVLAISTTPSDRVCTRPVTTDVVTVVSHREAGSHR
jgi:hypothetical protein